MTVFLKITDCCYVILSDKKQEFLDILQEIIKFAKTFFMRELLFLLIFLPLLSSGQNTSGISVVVTNDNIKTEWQLVQSVEGALFYVKKADCTWPQDGIYQEMILIKVVNTTEYDLVISWDILQWYDGTLWTRLPVRPENKHQLVLKGGEMLEGTCERTSQYYSSLTVFSRFLNYEDKPEMTKFELSNINISRYEK